MDMEDAHYAARELARPKFVAMANSIPIEEPSAVWLAAFAGEQAGGDPWLAVQFLARLYIAADRFASEQEAIIGNAKNVAMDFFNIIAKHKAELYALAYGDAMGGKAAATELLNAAGLSKYHAPVETAAE